MSIFFLHDPLSKLFFLKGRPASISRSTSVEWKHIRRYELFTVKHKLCQMFYTFVSVFVRLNIMYIQQMKFSPLTSAGILKTWNQSLPDFGRPFNIEYGLVISFPGRSRFWNVYFLLKFELWIVKCFSCLRRMNLTLNCSAIWIIGHLQFAH